MKIVIYVFGEIPYAAVSKVEYGYYEKDLVYD
jgi:hypothetical protein